MNEPAPANPVPSHWSTIARELVITTLGVLVALAINSWWTERQDRARERAYLNQLVADIDRSLLPENLPAAVAREDTASHATVSLVRAFRTQLPPPADSIAHWLFRAQTFAAYRPLTGTARALVTTRDIALIRNDSVRTLVIAMVQLFDENGARLAAFEQRWRDQAAELEQYTDFIRLKAHVLGADTSTVSGPVNPGLPEWPAAGRREPFPLTDYPALLRNRNVYRALVKTSTVHDNARGILQQELEGLRRVRAVFARAAGQ